MTIHKCKFNVTAIACCTKEYLILHCTIDSFGSADWNIVYCRHFKPVNWNGIMDNKNKAKNEQLKIMLYPCFISN